MVLCKRYVTSNYHLDNNLQINDQQPNQILEFSNREKLAGLISQVFLLNRYISELFSSLFEDTEKNFRRLKNLQEKTSEVQSKIPLIEQYLSRDDALTNMSRNSRVSWASNDNRTDLVSRNNMPIALNDLYSDCAPPPNLSILDQYNNNKSCLELYTNPSFFINEWIKDQYGEILKKEKQQRKKQRLRKIRRQMKGNSENNPNTNDDEQGNQVGEENEKDKNELKQSSVVITTTVTKDDGRVENLLHPISSKKIVPKTGLMVSKNTGPNSQPTKEEIEQDNGNIINNPGIPNIPEPPILNNLIPNIPIPPPPLPLNNPPSSILPPVPNEEKSKTIDDKYPMPDRAPPLPPPNRPPPLPVDTNNNIYDNQEQVNQEDIKIDAPPNRPPPVLPPKTVMNETEEDDGFDPYPPNIPLISIQPPRNPPPLPRDNPPSILPPVPKNPPPPLPLNNPPPLPLNNPPLSAPPPPPIEGYVNFVHEQDEVRETTETTVTTREVEDESMMEGQNPLLALITQKKKVILRLLRQTQIEQLKVDP